MKSPESYKSEYPESAKSKFAIPRDAEGKPNKEVFGLTRDFVEKLSKYPSFIGAAPYGSKMKGYSEETSDTDIAIFTELSAAKLSSDKEEIEMNKLHADVIETSHAHGGTEDIHPELYAINEDIIKRSIIDPNFYRGRAALVNFFGVVTGPKVAEYRKLIAEQVKALSEDEQKTFIHQLVLMALSLENKRKGEIEDRIPSTKEAGMITTRRAVWEKRINDVLKNTI